MTAPVLLVGGGPGPRDLLTLRAELVLRDAGTVVVDAVLTDLVGAVAPDAEVVLAPGDPNALVALVRTARPPVVRLYVGDPWLHPAHDPERSALTAAGVPVEPVPGVSAQIGTRTAAGQPLHHRHRSVVAVLTGSECAEPRDLVVSRVQNRSEVVRG